MVGATFYLANNHLFFLIGKYGFNTYNLLTSIVLGFNAISNLYANVNNNNDNNNNNNNLNDVSSVSGNANDVTVQNDYMVSK